MKTFLAIDFGTTQTSVAMLKEHSKQVPEVIEINDGQKTVKAIATALQLDDYKNITYFGAKALVKAEEDPEKTFQNFKVFVGKNSREFQLKTEQNSYSPDDLALLYLRKLRETIEEHYFNGTKLSDNRELTCIIGCPSDFNEIQKKTLKDIAANAGFPNPKLCDEPIGVIYYNHFFGGLELKPSQNILVYDFGGGTTDVVIAKVKVSDNGKIEPSVLSVSGLTDLGGRNFDEVIANYYMKENNYDLRTVSVKDKLHDQWVINLAARQAKEDLSSKNSVEKMINRLKVINSQRPNKLLLSRDKFNEICGGLIGKFDDPIYDALTLAGLSVDDVDVVILAGGSSAMPYVLESMRKMFPLNKTKILVSSGIEIIAQGLAVYGQVEELGIKAKKGEESQEIKGSKNINDDYFKKEEEKSGTSGTTTSSAENNDNGIDKKVKIPLWVIVMFVMLIIIFVMIYSSMQTEITRLEQNQATLQIQLEQAKRSTASQSSTNQSWWDWIWDKIVFWK